MRTFPSNNQIHINNKFSQGRNMYVFNEDKTSFNYEKHLCAQPLIMRLSFDKPTTQTNL